VLSGYLILQRTTKLVYELFQNQTAFFLIGEKSTNSNGQNCHVKFIKEKKGKNNFRIGISCQVHKVRSS
jgi:hypothetical protein